MNYHKDKLMIDTQTDSGQTQMDTHKQVMIIPLGQKYRNYRSALTVISPFAGTALNSELENI